MSTDPDTMSRFCAAVIANMVKDAEGREEGDRLRALAWLASSEATIYFDGAGFTQSRALLNSPWRTWADEVLDDFYESERSHYTRQEVSSLRVLTSTLSYLAKLAEARPN